MNQTSNSKSMPLKADVLAVNNRFSILSDIDSQEDLLVIDKGRSSGNEDDQIQDSSVQTDNNEDKQMQDNSAQRSGAAAGGRFVDNTSEQVSPDTYSKKSSLTEKPCVAVEGDSMIKHVDPMKLSKKKVHKYTYPGETAESISTEVSTLNPQIHPSHVIIHVGTNNIPIDSPEDCAQEIGNLAANLKQKFPHAKIALSGIIQRQDMQVAGKIEEVNKILKQKCLSDGMSFIDNFSIDNTCLNSSNIHLNAKATAFLATKFIKFLRGNQHSMSSSRNEDFHISTLHQLGNLLRMITTSPVHKHRKRKRV